jgi:hypothetical protein
LNLDLVIVFEVDSVAELWRVREDEAVDIEDDGS